MGNCCSNSRKKPGESGDDNLESIQANVELPSNVNPSVRPEEVPESIQANVEVPSNVNPSMRPEEVAAPTQPPANHCITYTHQELKAITNNFRTFLGSGGFGSVFRGKLENNNNGLDVAVKVLDQSSLQGENEFRAEVLMLSLLRHPNLVTLIGDCSDEEHRLLVYEFMPLGSLEEHLFGTTAETVPLDWNTRMKIATGVARGLQFLHNWDPPVIYRDMKSANILLDDGYEPKLSDFGLAKFGPTGGNAQVVTRVLGTRGYCSPEYIATGKLNTMIDIYSLGVVLLELLTGRRAVLTDGTHIGNWASPLFHQKRYEELADPLLRGEYSLFVLRMALDLAFISISRNAAARPTSTDVLHRLEYIATFKYGSPQPENMEEEGGARWPGFNFDPADFYSHDPEDRFQRRRRVDRAITT